MATPQTPTPSPLELAKAYHAIIEKEYKEIEKRVHSYGSIIEVSHRAAEVCHNKKHLASIISTSLNIPQNKANNIIDHLIAKGFLINIAYDDTPCTKQGCCNTNKECYRSIHMDLALRSTDIRYYPGAAPMVASSKLAVVKQPYASPQDRCILPDGTTTCPSNTAATQLAQQLNKAIKNFIGDNNYADALIEALKQYLKTRAGGRTPYGYDQYQAAAIIEALNQAAQGKTAAVIVAPTGSGKTEIFSIITLAILLRNRAQGRQDKALLIYPRKMLEIDQAARFLELMKALATSLENRGLQPLTLGIRDGDTHEIEDDLRQKSEALLRGIPCNKGKLYAKKNKNNQIEIHCCDNKGNCTHDPLSEKVLMVTRDKIKNADIMITNIWTLGFRMLSLNPNDINICDIPKTAVIVLDEAHEYDSVHLGDLSHMLREITLLRTNNNLPEPFIIVSTATLRDPQKFTEKLTNRKNKVIDLTFDTISKHYNITLNGERLFITTFIQLLPTTGWNTYISEWAAATLYTWLAYRDKGHTAHQSIIFINNVRELNRTARSIFPQALSLGSPIDLLCRRKNTCKNPMKKLDTLKHICCLNKNLCDKAASDGTRTLIEPHYDIVFSNVPQDERATIYEKFRKQDLGMLFATSSLELGMDYPNVSIILNAGLDRPDSLIQRIGRGGRSLKQTLNTVLAIILIRNNPLDYRFYADINRVQQIALHNPNMLPEKKIADKLLSIQALSLLRYAVAKELLKYCHSLKCPKNKNSLDALIDAVRSVSNKELAALDVDIDIKDSIIKINSGILQYINNILEMIDYFRKSKAEINDEMQRILKAINNILDELNEISESKSSIEDEINDVKMLFESFKSLLNILNIVLNKFEEYLDTFEILNEKSVKNICSYGDEINKIKDNIRQYYKDMRHIANIEVSDSDIGNKLETIIDDIFYIRREINEKLLKDIDNIFNKLKKLCSSEVEEP